MYIYIYIYLSVRRGGDDAFAGCSQNGGSARGRSTGVSPHRSTNSMREMITGAATLYRRPRALSSRSLCCVADFDGVVGVLGEVWRMTLCIYIVVDHCAYKSCVLV